MNKIPEKWFHKHDKYTDDIMDNLIKQSKCSVLVITGDKGVQVNREYIEKIKGFKKEHITSVIVQNMNHIQRGV